MTNEFHSQLEPLSVIRAIEANLVDGYRYLAGLMPGAEISEESDMVRVLTPLRQPTFNSILCARFGRGSTERRISCALEPLERRKLPGMWWIGPSTHPLDLGKRLASRGLFKTDTLSGMALDLRGPAQPPSVQPEPLELHISEARTADDLAAWARPFSEGFGIHKGTLDALAPLADAVLHRSGRTDVLSPETPAAHLARFFVGTIDDASVSSAMLFAGAGVAGLYGVATLTAYRNHGSATALVQAAMNEARAAGFRTCILHASPMAASLYRRLGFVEYCRLRTYTYIPPSV